MGQVPLFNENLCVKNTSKTYHEDFSRKRYFGLSWKRSPFFVRTLEKQISFISYVLEDSYVLIWKPESARSDLFIFTT